MFFDLLLGRNSLQFSHQVFVLKAASGYKNTSDGEFHTFVFSQGTSASAILVKYQHALT